MVPISGTKFGTRFWAQEIAQFLLFAARFFTPWCLTSRLIAQVCSYLWWASLTKHGSSARQPSPVKKSTESHPKNIHKDRFLGSPNRKHETLCCRIMPQAQQWENRWDV